jgi:hypothetical protein
MKSDNVDPAALLIAIIPFAGSPLIEEGSWHVLNTILALVVLVVLWAYTIAGRRRQQARSGPECLAIGLVIGMVSAIALAYPIQELTNNIDTGTWWGLIGGSYVAGAVVVVLIQSRDRSQVTPGEQLTQDVKNIRALLERHEHSTDDTGRALEESTNLGSEGRTN